MEYRKTFGLGRIHVSTKRSLSNTLFFVTSMLTFFTLFVVFMGFSPAYSLYLHFITGIDRGGILIFSLPIMCIVGIGAVFLLFFSFYFFRYKKYLDEEEDSTRENLAILKEGMLILKSIFSLADKMTGENAPDFAIALGVMKERLSIMRLDEFRSDFDHMDVFFSLNNTLNALKDDMVIKVSPSTVSSIIAGKERGEIDEKRIHMNTIEAIRNHMEKLHKIITAEMRTANTYLSAVASERKKV